MGTKLGKIKKTCPNIQNLGNCKYVWTHVITLWILNWLKGIQTNVKQM